MIAEIAFCMMVITTGFDGQAQRIAPQAMEPRPCQVCEEWQGMMLGVIRRNSGEDAPVSIACKPTTRRPPALPVKS